MPTYCCVYGCQNNTTITPNLSFYSLPEDKERKKKWVDLIDRCELLEKKSKSYKVCSVHFSNDMIKNKNLKPGAIPSLHLPGSNVPSSSSSKNDAEIQLAEPVIIEIKQIKPATTKEFSTQMAETEKQIQTCNQKNTEEDPLTHADIVCNSCESPVVGYRYKCVTCVDYDLCVRCERTEIHPEHFMLRIPRPIKMKFVDNLVKKWQEFFKSEHITPGTLKDGQGSSDSSDDEPITKYKNYDSGVDLSEDIKEKIRKEVQRVIKKKTENEINNRIINKAEELNSLATKRQEKSAKQLRYKKKLLKQAEEKKRQAEEEKEIESKRMKLEMSAEQNDIAVAPPEVNFDNVDQTSNFNTPVNPVVDLKPEFSIVPSVNKSSNLPSVPAPTVTYSFVPGVIPVSFIPTSQPSGSSEQSSVNPMSRLLGISVSQPDEQTGSTGPVGTDPMATSSMGATPIATGPTVLCPSTVSSVLGIPLSDIPLASSSNPDQHQSPVMHVKLSDDLTQLMIEVTSNNQKTVYAYSDK